METLAERYPLVTLLLLGLVVISVGAVMYVFARMLLQSINGAARYEPMTTLMVILGTISVVALVGALFTHDESAFTIAATGVGAFAGALTARAQALVVEENENSRRAKNVEEDEDT